MERYNEIPNLMGKFIQVVIDDEHYIRFSTTNDYHKNILERLLSEKDIPFRTSPEDERMPLQKGERYEMVGAGFSIFINNEEEKRLIFGQTSFDYGIGPNEKHIEKMKEYFPKEYSIAIRK